MSSTTPPPLRQKQFVKRKTEGGQGENQESSSSTAASDANESTTGNKTETIDELLGGLSSDLEKIGVRTTAKGHCASCNKCIAGKVKKKKENPAKQMQKNLNPEKST